MSSSTPLIHTILGQSHTPGHITAIDDPDVEGVAIFPKHDYPGGSSPLVLARKIAPEKHAKLLFQDGGEEVYLFDGMWLNVQMYFCVGDAFLLVGVLRGCDETS